MPAQSHADLRSATLAGDREAFGELLSRHYTRVVAYVRFRMGPEVRARESVHDIVQSACREALLRADRFEYQGEAAFRSYLCEAAMRKLADRRKRHLARCRDIRREAGDVREGLATLYRTTLGPLCAAIRTEEIERLERAIDTLEASPKQALALRALCELEYEEIARRMKTSTDNVRQLVSRARAALGSRLGALDRDA